MECDQHITHSRFQVNEVDKLHLHPVKHSCKTDRGAVVVQDKEMYVGRQKRGRREGVREGGGGPYIVFNVCLVVVR